MIFYLSGSISHAPEHNTWRPVVTQRLEQAGHLVLDPMRGKRLEDISPDGMRTVGEGVPPELFVARDFTDLRVADALFVVYPKAPKGPEGMRRQSVGTWMECGIAAWLHKPIILVTDDPNVYGHAFVLTHAAFITAELERGIQAALWLGKGRRGPVE